MEPTTLPYPSVRNPFGSAIGQPLDDDQVDIAEINAEAFKACQQLVVDVEQGGYAAALTVFGDSGTGKTHLIGRVRRWLNTKPNHLFVFLRMETSPSLIWRHVRRALAQALLKPLPGGQRAIARLLEHQRHALEELPDRNLGIVVEQLLEGRHAKDCGAWLRGDGLPDEVLTRLGLASPKAEDDPETNARIVSLALCDLIRPGVVVFCMDQIEAILSPPHDRDGAYALGRLVSCIVEETRNAAVVSCEQTSYIAVLEKVLDKATSSKLFGRRVPIRPLDWKRAGALIEARLRTVPELAAERTKNGPYWPLEEVEIKTAFSADAATARRVISHCYDLFQRWQTGEAVPRAPLDEDLQNKLDERMRPEAEEQTESILRASLPLVFRAAGLDYAANETSAPVAFTTDRSRLTVAICNEENATSFANRVKKVSELWKPGPGRRLVILRDARRPPTGPGAKKTRQMLDALEKQGGQICTVSREAVETLAALRRLLADAESGDLAYYGEPISAGTLEGWIARHLPAALDPLIAVFGQAPPPIAPKLAALLAAKKLITLTEAAGSLEVSPEVLEKCVRADPGQFGILGGRTPVLFQPVTSPLEAAANT